MTGAELSVSCYQLEPHLDERPPNALPSTISKPQESRPEPSGFSRGDGE